MQNTCIFKFLTNRNPTYWKFNFAFDIFIFFLIEKVRHVLSPILLIISTANWTKFTTLINVIYTTPVLALQIQTGVPLAKTNIKNLKI